MSKPLKYPLLSQLKKSLVLLKHRKEMIPKYVNQSEAFAGKNHYTMDMIPQVQSQIDEMKAAIDGIEEWKKSLRNMKSEI